VNQLADWNFAPEFWPAGRLLSVLGILRQGSIGLILRCPRQGWRGGQLGRVAPLPFNEGPVALKADFAEVSCGIKTSLRGEGAIIVGKGKCSRVRSIPHFAFPVERTQRISTDWLNVARSPRLRVGNVEGEGSGNSGDTKVIPRSAREPELIHDVSVLQGDSYCVIRDFHGIIGNLQEPEKPIRSNSWIEIVQKGRQTDVPEIQSYQDEGAVVRLGGGSSSRWVG
jgi:hypothetical protein